MTGNPSESAGKVTLKKTFISNIPHGHNKRPRKTGENQLLLIIVKSSHSQQSKVSINSVDTRIGICFTESIKLNKMS